MRDLAGAMKPEEKRFTFVQSWAVRDFARSLTLATLTDVEHFDLGSFGRLQ
jgi:hypothetical protein